MSFFYAFKQSESDLADGLAFDGLVDDAGGVVAGGLVGDRNVANADREALAG